MPPVSALSLGMVPGTDTIYAVWSDCPVCYNHIIFVNLTDDFAMVEEQFPEDTP